MPEQWVRQVAGLADERSWRALVRDWRPEVDSSLIKLASSGFFHQLLADLVDPRRVMVFLR